MIRLYCKTVFSFKYYLFVNTCWVCLEYFFSSEIPFQVDMLALERELAAADNEVDNELENVFKNDGRTCDGLLSGSGFPGSEAPLSADGLPLETAEERRLEKRSKVLLRMLRVHQQQYGWDEPLTLQGLCHGNTKKQVSQLVVY